jgi:hypothetical protein
MDGQILTQKKRVLAGQGHGDSVRKYLKGFSSGIVFAHKMSG